MIIDKEPDINSDNRTIKVQNNIDTDEETLILVNGLIAIISDDIDDITDDTITISEGTGTDLDNDVIAVMYTSL